MVENKFSGFNIKCFANIGFNSFVFNLNTISFLAVTWLQLLVHPVHLLCLNGLFTNTRAKLWRAVVVKGTNREKQLSQSGPFPALQSNRYLLVTLGNFLKGALLFPETNLFQPQKIESLLFPSSVTC